MEVTTSGMVMEIKAVAEALKYQHLKKNTRLSSSSTQLAPCRKSRNNVYADWLEPPLKQ